MQKNSKSEIIPRIANRNIYYICKIHLLGYSGIWSVLSALGYFYVTTRHKRVKLKHRCKSGTGVAGCPGSSSRQFGCIRTATHTQALSRVCLPPTHTHTQRETQWKCVISDTHTTAIASREKQPTQHFQHTWDRLGLALSKKTYLSRLSILFIRAAARLFPMQPMNWSFYYVFDYRFNSIQNCWHLLYSNDLNNSIMNFCLLNCFSISFPHFVNLIFFYFVSLLSFRVFLIWQQPARSSSHKIQITQAEVLC